MEMADERGGDADDGAPLEAEAAPADLNDDDFAAMRLPQVGNVPKSLKLT